MKAAELFRTRIVYTAHAVAEMVLGRVPGPAKGSLHEYKYRLAYVVKGICVVRYDNEAGKGDHRHFGAKESDYAFTNPEALLTDFQGDIARWNYENSDS